MPADPREDFFSKQLGNEPPLTRTTAERLLAASHALAALQPWDLLAEEQMILVEDPAGKETHCCTAIGTLGESFGLIVFLGHEGFSFVRRMQASEGDTSQYLAGNRSLSLEFVPRPELEPPDREMLKALAFKSARGALVPQFRSLRPGYLPWFVNESEGRTLALCIDSVNRLLAGQPLEKLLDYWPRPNSYPLITSAGVEIVNRWPEPEALPLPANFDREHLNQVIRRGLRVSGTIEADFFHFPIPIGKPNERKMAVRMALAADAASGMIFPPATAEPDRAEADVLAATILTAVDSSGAIPAAIVVRTPRQKAALASLAESLGAELRFSSELPAVDNARESLLNHLVGG